MDKLERIIEFDPAFDHRSKKSGIHGMNLRLVLKGPKGAFQFVIYTNWHLPHVHEQVVRKQVEKIKAGVSDQEIEFMFFIVSPFPADVGYHSPVPIYEGQLVGRNSCKYLDGRPCYYDGSGAQANSLFEKFTEHGETAVWEELEKQYQIMFGEEKEED